MCLTQTVRRCFRVRSLAVGLLTLSLYATPVAAAPDRSPAREPRIAGHAQTALSLLLSPGAATIGMVLTTMLLARRPRVTSL
ncbi:MAG: hypothetical protein IT442_09770 [Phycisphaeraceae bacterium]|nr:hypothetical protein [Phycisphaeraceae bacterium]